MEEKTEYWEDDDLTTPEEDLFEEDDYTEDNEYYQDDY